MVTRWIILLKAALILTIVGCTGESPPPQLSSDLTHQALPPDDVITTVAAQQEEIDDVETIEVPIDEHTMQIFHQGQEVEEKELSEQNVQELRTWWDSLPEPIQSQVKANEVGVQVVSTITTTPTEQPIQPDLVDAHVEKTGRELNKIIGSSTEMTFGVNTTLAEHNENASTSITLTKKVPVKLSEFSAQVFLRQGNLSNDNIHSLQYWWLTLPTELQEKIQRKEITIEVIAYSIDKGNMDKPQENIGAASAENALVAADIISQMAGIQKIGNKRYSIAQIETSSFIEPANKQNMNYPASEYIEIRLKTNKPALTVPSPTL